MQFEKLGVVRLSSRLPQNRTGPIRERIFAEFDRLGLRAGGKLSSAKLRSLPIFRQIGRLEQMVKIGSELDRLFPDELLAAMGSLMTSPWLRPARPHPQLLLSFPHKEAWSLDRLNWHVDKTPTPADEIVAVQAFVLIDDVASRGGATLALAGTHKLPYLPGSRGNSARNILGEDPIFASLFGSAGADKEYLWRPREIRGVPISIVEMCGRAGDVYLMDMRVLHSPSVNATKAARMMASLRLVRP